MNTHTATEARDEAYHGIFTTALEGGISYWSRCGRYRWTKPGLTRQELDEARCSEISDYTGFEAHIYDTESAYEPAHADRPAFLRRVKIKDPVGGDFYASEYRIDRAVIAAGVGRFIEEYKSLPARSYFGAAARALRNGDWDDLDVDAEIADAVVQLGLFGELIYG